MKLSRRNRKRLNKKLRPKYVQENLLLKMYRNRFKGLTSKLSKIDDLDKIDDVISEYDMSGINVNINAFAKKLFTRSEEEFDSILGAFIKDPSNKYLEIRAKEMLGRRKEFLPYLEALKHNISLIKDLPSDLARKLKGKYLEGTSFRGTAFAKELESRLGKRAKTIIRTESAKITSTLTQVRMQKIGLNAYLWSTSGDSRVRGSHALLDGVLVFWDDPPTIDGYTSHVGRFINCRCVAIPVVALDDLQFPVTVADRVYIQNTYIKGSKGKYDSKIISGNLISYTKEAFRKKYEHLFSEDLY